MSEKIKVLFVCVHNGGRSQIAEAFLNNMAGERFVAESAGLEPGVMNKLVVKSMKDVGIDISKNKFVYKEHFYIQGRNIFYAILHAISICQATCA